MLKLEVLDPCLCLDGCRGCLAPAVFLGLTAWHPRSFGRSVNPIQTRGADYAHHITTWHPRLQNLNTSSAYFYTIFPTVFSGKRQDEDLIEAWRKMKEKQGVDFNVLFDKSDLDRWDHSDFVLGLFSMSHMDYV